MKTIVITGATSGIGEALALKYSQNETLLALCGRNKEKLDSIKSKCLENKAKVVTEQLDITNKTSVSKWINKIEQNNPIDIVIASAGVSLGTLSHIEADTDKHHAIFETNINGVLNTILPSIEFMKKRKSGHVVLISSVAGLGCLSGASAYAASKAAIKIYGHSLRNELTPYNIKVSVVCPGFIKTPMTNANKFKMPFIMDLNRATHIIHKKISKGKHHIVLPKRLYYIAKAFHLLPVGLVQYIQRGFVK